MIGDHIENRSIHFQLLGNTVLSTPNMHAHRHLYTKTDNR